MFDSIAMKLFIETKRNFRDYAPKHKFQFIHEKENIFRLNESGGLCATADNGEILGRRVMVMNFYRKSIAKI